jgi:hypothetical protein
MSIYQFAIQTQAESELAQRFQDKLVESLGSTLDIRCYCDIGEKISLGVFRGLEYAPALVVTYNNWEPLTTGIDEEVEKIAFRLLFEGGA